MSHIFNQLGEQKLKMRSQIVNNCFIKLYVCLREYCTSLLNISWLRIAYFPNVPRNDSWGRSLNFKVHREQSVNSVISNATYWFLKFIGIELWWDEILSILYIVPIYRVGIFRGSYKVRASVDRALKLF